jgi:hypothetical protein
MPSPYPITALLGSLLYIMRHEPESQEHRGALLAALRGAFPAGGLRIDVEDEALRLDGADVPLDAPGASFLAEQMRVHGVRQAKLPPGIADEDLLRFAAAVAAFGGTYNTFDELLAALGPSAERIALTRGAEGLDLFRGVPWLPKSMFEPIRPEDFPPPPPGITRGDAGALEAYRETTFEDAIRRGQEAMTPGGDFAAAQPASLDELLARGRDAIKREDWSGLLDVALQIVEAEAEAPSEVVSSTYRIELKRLLGRKPLSMIARLAHGDRKQEAITLLRRFGADATEILMDLLVDGRTRNERRGYYSAIVQMSEGTDTIVRHLGHQEWYVVRNAAELCGKLELADAVPGLIRQSTHPDERVRKAVAQALAKIGTPPATEPLRRLLADPVSGVRLHAVGAMGGRRARHMTGAIADLLRKEDESDVQHESLLALGRIGTPEAILVLKEWTAPGGLLRGRRPVALRLTAIKALATTGPPAVDILSTLQQDDDEEVRAAATSALAAIRP